MFLMLILILILIQNSYMFHMLPVLLWKHVECPQPNDYYIDFRNQVRKPVFLWERGTHVLLLLANVPFSQSVECEIRWPP